MRWLSKLAVVAAALTLLAGCRPPRDRWADVVGPEVLAKASLEYYWKCEMPLNRGEEVRKLWRLDENIYALTSANRLLAVDAVRGRYKWSCGKVKSSEKLFAPCHADGVVLPRTIGIANLLSPSEKNRLPPFNGVIFNTLSYALLIDRDTGELMRKLDFKFSANCPGSSDGVNFYVGSSKGWYYAVRLSDGLCEWTMATDAMISARPTVFGRHLYVASRDGNLYAIRPDVRRNRRVWKQQTDGPISANFWVDRRGCFVPSEDYRLYLFDAITGEKLWVFRGQRRLRRPVQVGLRSAFVLADGGRFYAVDVGTGRKRWDLTEGRLVLAVIGPRACVLTDKRDLWLVHEMLGKVELRLPMTGLDLFVANAGKPIVFAGAADGKLACLRPVGAGHLTKDMLED